MVQWKEIVSLVLVGACWGCTNPLLRKGSSVECKNTPKNDNDTSNKESGSFLSSIKESLSKFRRWRVWLPYAVNQSGSLLYYYLLASSDLSVAVPVCNALSLVFSCITSYILGERVDRPLKAILGSTLVMAGVAICMSSQQEAGVLEEKHLLHDEPKDEL
jgi:drug/metabolite transporter (DMT)-like permease